jgi:hypothetical protein
VTAAVRQIAASCSVAAAPAQRADLLRGEDVKIQPPALAQLLHLGRRVALQPVDLLRPAKHAVELGQELVLPPRRAGKAGAPALDAAPR